MNDDKVAASVTSIMKHNLTLTYKDLTEFDLLFEEIPKQSLEQSKIILIFYSFENQMLLIAYNV